MFARLKLSVLGFIAMGTAAATVVGCSSAGGLEEAAVHGRVTYQGKPVEKGKIRFVPVKGTKGPANFGMINQGQYSVTARGGVTVGTHRVEIQAYRPAPGARPYTEEQADGQIDIKPGDLPEEQFLPDQYNRKSTLEITIDPGSGSLTKDFDLR